MYTKSISWKAILFLGGKTMKNFACFVGGGVSTVCGLGAYHSDTLNGETYDGFTGASIGAVIAVSLAAEKTPEEIRDFLTQSVEDFCKPIIGKNIIRKRTNEFLGYIKYRDLPKECTVSVTKIGSKKPVLVTKYNSGNLTAGEVAAASASLPGLFLPTWIRLEGNGFFVLDGGMTANPPIIPEANNTIYTFVREWKKPSNSVWAKRKAYQENLATKVVRVSTLTSTRGTKHDVFTSWHEGILH